MYSVPFRIVESQQLLAQPTEIYLQQHNPVFNQPLGPSQGGVGFVAIRNNDVFYYFDGKFQILQVGLRGQILIVDVLKKPKWITIKTIDISKDIDTYKQQIQVLKDQTYLRLNQASSSFVDSFVYQTKDYSRLVSQSRLLLSSLQSKLFNIKIDVELLSRKVDSLSMTTSDSLFINVEKMSQIEKNLSKLGTNSIIDVSDNILINSSFSVWPPHGAWKILSPEIVQGSDKSIILTTPFSLTQDCSGGNVLTFYAKSKQSIMINVCGEQIELSNAWKEYKIQKQIDTVLFDCSLNIVTSVEIGRVQVETDSIQSVYNYRSVCQEIILNHQFIETGISGYSGFCESNGYVTVIVPFRIKKVKPPQVKLTLLPTTDFLNEYTISEVTPDFFIVKRQKNKRTSFGQFYFEWSVRLE